MPKSSVGCNGFPRLRTYVICKLFICAACVSVFFFWARIAVQHGITDSFNEHFCVCCPIGMVQKLIKYDLYFVVRVLI